METQEPINSKYTKYIDLAIFEALHDLEITKGCRLGGQELCGLVYRITDPTRKLPYEFIADCLDDIALLYRKLHEEQKIAFGRLENQKLVS